MTTTRDAPAIALSGVRFTYGAAEVLRGLDLTVPRGSTLGFVGPNGAGKTTTFSIIAGFLRPRVGSAQVLGGSVQDIRHIKGRLSILPQDASLITDVGILRQLVFFAELLGFDGPRAEAEAMRVLELVGLAEHVRKHPGHLSHGMAKRAGLAQAFLGNPEVVLLDEPTAGLDPFAAKQIRDLVRSMRGERTLVVSSHNLAEIQDLCTDVALIHQGQILQQGDIGTFTRRQNQLKVQILNGHPPVTFFQGIEALPGVAHVMFEPQPMLLTVRLKDDAPPAEDIIKEIVGRVFALNLSIGEIQRGTSLEDVFMSLTKGPGGPGGKPG
jgi:ABC-type multidrug transport system ATPase subunit